MVNSKSKNSIGSILVYLVISLLCLSIIIPMWMVLVGSFTREKDLIAAGGLLLIPKSICLDAYKSVFTDNQIVTALKNSVFLSGVGTVLQLLVTAMMAYPLSKKLKYGGIIGFMVYFTMLFGGGMIPTFLLIKQLGLINSLWSLILLGLVSPYNMILMRNFFAEIPLELEESALIDGAGHGRILFSVVMPLSLPVMATIGLFAMVGLWNNWLGPIIYIQDKAKWPLQTILMQMLQSAFISKSIDQQDFTLVQMEPKESLKYATLLVTTVPIMLVYPFLQKYFAKGLLIGAVKG